MSAHTRPSRLTFGHLNLEQLEAREVPAVATWVGQNSNFTDARNWSTGSVPGPADSLVFSSVAPPGYGTGEQQQPPGSPPVPPVPPGNPNLDCVFPSGTEQFFARIEIKDGYAGTVRFPTNVKFGYYIQSAGSTWQAAGTAVTVTTGFDWTRGTINTNTVAPAYYNLAPFAVGSATPFEGGSVSLGSTITLQGDEVTQRGARLTLNDGTYNITHRQVSLHAMQFSLLEMTPGAPVPKPPKETDGEIKIKDNTTDNPEPTKKVIIDPKATAKIVTVGGRRGIPRVTMTGEKPLVENSGKFTIDGGAKLEFAPDQGEEGIGGGLTQKHADAVTQLACGSTIICQEKTEVFITKGRLELKDAPGTTQRDTAQDAITITSPKPGLTTLYIGHEAILTHDANDKGFVQLKVGGNFACLGVLNLVASRVAEKSDTVEVTHSVGFGGKPLTVDWYSETGNTMAAGKGWTMITSKNMGKVAKPIDPVPQMVTQTNPGNFGITLDWGLNGAKDEFKVKIK